MVDLSRIYTFSMIPLGIIFILSARDLYKSHHECELPQTIKICGFC